MKKGIILAISLFSSVALADPTIFNMELGATTETQLKSMYRVRHTGTNKFNHGNMYAVPASAINFDGLRQVTTIFNKDGVLVAVLTTLPKSKFNHLNQILGGKYKQVSQNIPFVGDKSATYRDGETEITLNSPHLGLEMTMNYIRDDLTRTFNQQSEAEKRQKQQNDESLL